MPDSGVAKVIQNLDVFANTMMKKRRRAGQKIAIILEAYAKANHGDTPRQARWVYPGAGVRRWRPAGKGWGDVTTATQQGTHATISRDIQAYLEVALFASMDYNVWLELARNGKWAWIWPAMIANKQRILDIFATELNVGTP